MTPARAVSVFAPAKVNLTLHVTGQRDDGYHFLDSLVAFADVGDRLFIQQGNTPSLTTEGPEARDVPADMDNLILRAAGLFDDVPGVSFLLTKNLPVSSGIGGGSADAAAAFRGLLLYLSKGETQPDFSTSSLAPLGDRLMALGADIPMCLLSEYARVRGIGEQIQPIDSLPTLDAVLINPRRPVSTPAVFRAMRRRDNPPMPDTATSFKSKDAFVCWLAEQRNDLEEPAMRLEPSISDALAALRAGPACALARMSGSGATCFGLYDTKEQAQTAALSLRKSHPDWWVTATQLGSQTQLALPRLS
ncbi:4-(cytidine 5'-diphospho)-2-C-methyl-D-erythritol kinase [uncultured Roseobacter sp.]|uniref:4-(cytidine 5'-diphospho)-2-C-methyl-D-erythritol kinase n=1 Tax=uncultured Roseobacter sp. TaxID=114847 RepID=UPI00261678A0|nr:4-(cytidine 5'-diphospho)-2-C-methyl-D-erythritol kinase [uncultured Roseobacter sp.]